MSMRFATGEKPQQSPWLLMVRLSAIIRGPKSHAFSSLYSGLDKFIKQGIAIISYMNIRVEESLSWAEDGGAATLRSL